MCMDFYKDLIELLWEEKKEGNWEERCPNLNRMHLISVLFCQDHLDYITSNNSW